MRSVMASANLSPSKTPVNGASRRAATVSPDARARVISVCGGNSCRNVGEARAHPRKAATGQLCVRPMRSRCCIVKTAKCDRGLAISVELDGLGAGVESCTKAMLASGAGELAGTWASHMMQCGAELLLTQLTFVPAFTVTGL